MKLILYVLDGKNREKIHDSPLYYLELFRCSSIHCLRFQESSASFLSPFDIIIMLIVPVYLSLFMKLLLSLFPENTIIVLRKLPLKLAALGGKSLGVFSVYRKILYKSISTQSTTILIAAVDYKDKCKGRKRKPTPPSQSSVWAAQTSPFIMNLKQHMCS
jgi:hypothetical protein